MSFVGNPGSCLERLEVARAPCWRCSVIFSITRLRSVTELAVAVGLPLTTNRGPNTCICTTEAVRREFAIIWGSITECRRCGRTEGILELGGIDRR